MKEDRGAWPLVMGITAGVVGGIIAGLYLYYMKSEDGADTKLRDAREIISQCHDKIKEIEATIDALRQPVAV